MELGLFEWIIGGIVSVGLALFAYLNGRIANVRDNTNAIERDHLKFRTHVAENYSTKDDIKNIENKLTHTLDRVHGRMDDIRQILEYIKEK